jgi:hypothetical protein
MIILVLILILLVPSISGAAEDLRAWTSDDTALQLVYTAITVADWSQTLHISRNPDQYFETNKHLGKHPSEGSVNTWFVSTIALNAAVSYILPKPYRTIWQGFWIGYEYGFVERNVSIGLKLSF